MFNVWSLRTILIFRLNRRIPGQLRHPNRCHQSRRLPIPSLQTDRRQRRHHRLNGGRGGLLSSPFEKLDRSLVCFGGTACPKRSKVPSPAGLRIGLSRVETVFTRFQFADHLAFLSAARVHGYWMRVGEQITHFLVAHLREFLIPEADGI